MVNLLKSTVTKLANIDNFTIEAMDLLDDVEEMVRDSKRKINLSVKKD